MTTGTFFHGTRVSLRVWIFVLFEMAANKNGIAAREIERKYGVAPKTAWLMTQKIRTAIGNRAPHMMVGTIVADESWVGGDPTNDHHRKRQLLGPKDRACKSPRASGPFGLTEVRFPREHGPMDYAASSVLRSVA